ncbi:MAG: DUF4179 domain-containing protein [Oscillospiraceae bacterium]
MTNKTVKDAINSRLESVKYSPTNLIYANGKFAKRPTNTVHFKRIACVAAACCVMFTFSVGVMAASIPQLNSLFTLVGERIANMVQPIVQESTSSDIRMNVLAAMNDDDAVVIYLTLQDLKGAHIDATTELYDMDISGIVFPQTEIINYDAASRMVTMRVTGTCGEKLNGQKISIKLNTILAGKNQQYNKDTGYTVADIVKSRDAKELFYPPDISEYSGNEFYSEMSKTIEQKKYPVLKPDVDAIQISAAPWTYISAIGMIDDTLRIQQNPSDDMGRYNKLDFSLADENGVLLNDLPSGSVSFGSVEEHGIYRYVDFEEQAFKLPENADLSKIKLLASTTSYAEKISGEWKTSFVLNSITEQKSSECIINMNPWEITDVSVSPIGVTVKGHGKMYDYSETPEIVARRLDGSIIEFSSNSVSVASSDNKENSEEIITYKNAFSIPVDIAEISAITINGIDIPVK